MGGARWFFGPDSNPKPPGPQTSNLLFEKNTRKKQNNIRTYMHFPNWCPKHIPIGILAHLVKGWGVFFITSDYQRYLGSMFHHSQFRWARILKVWQIPVTGWGEWVHSPHQEERFPQQKNTEQNGRKTRGVSYPYKKKTSKNPNKWPIVHQTLCQGNSSILLDWIHL